MVNHDLKRVFSGKESIKLGNMSAEANAVSKLMRSMPFISFGLAYDINLERAKPQNAIAAE